MLYTYIITNDNKMKTYEPKTQLRIKLLSILSLAFTPTCSNHYPECYIYHSLPIFYQLY